MKRLTAAQQEALTQLQRHAAWPVLLQGLRDILTRLQEECMRADDLVHVRRLQGQARLLMELLERFAPPS